MDGQTVWHRDANTCLPVSAQYLLLLLLRYLEWKSWNRCLWPWDSAAVVAVCGGYSYEHSTPPVDELQSLVMERGEREKEGGEGGVERGGGGEGERK